MGGGEWIEQRQMEQKAILNHAYQEVMPVETREEAQVEWKPDYLDNIYIGLRTFIPSWVLALCIVIGGIVVITFTFKQQMARFLKFLGGILESKEK